MKQTISVAVSNQKGGVGKSTLTVLLASYLHYVKGLSVAVVDCDTLQHSISNMRTRDMQAVEKNDYYKQLLMTQWERLHKKAYPIVEATPQQARDSVDELIATMPSLEVVLLDLPGSVASEGVFATIINMDYVLTPLVADRIVMQSTLCFSTAVLDYIRQHKDIPLKEFLFLWNKVDRRVTPEVFDAYTRIMEKLNMTVLETVIPESKRFDKELSIAGAKTYFRCTLLPPHARTLRGSNIPALAEELCSRINL